MKKIIQSILIVFLCLNLLEIGGAFEEKKLENNFKKDVARNLSVYVNIEQNKVEYNRYFLSDLQIATANSNFDLLQFKLLLYDVGSKGNNIFGSLNYLGKSTQEIKDILKNPIKKISNLLTRDGKTLYVGGNGPENYSKIQDAIDDTTNGDTVFVFNGTYFESVIIDRSIHLIGECRDSTIIENSINDSDAIQLAADGITIRGFTIQDNIGEKVPTASGIVTPLDSSFNDITICDNYITGFNFGGIFIYSGSDFLIENNIIFSNNLLPGIFIIHGMKITVKDNIIFNQQDGIRILNFFDPPSYHVITGNHINSCSEFGIDLFDSKHNTLSNNTLTDCGIRIGANTYPDSYQNTFFNNTVNGKPLLYLEGESDKIINTPAGQVILVYCDNITLTNLTISDTTQGIELFSSTNCLLINNTLNSNAYEGIFLLYSFNNTLKENTIDSNEVGISIVHSSKNNSIIGNSLNDNYCGIYLSGLYFSEGDDPCSNNIISQNRIVDNENYGLYLTTSSNENMIISNEISSNEIGLMLRYHSQKNEIVHNNFLLNEQNAFYRFREDNFYATAPICRNKWRNNYWEQGRILPKLIFGTMGFSIFHQQLQIKWINVDWTPSLKQFHIS